MGCYLLIILALWRLWVWMILSVSEILGCHPKLQLLYGKSCLTRFRLNPICDLEIETTTHLLFTRGFAYHFLNGVLLSLTLFVRTYCSSA